MTALLSVSRFRADAWSHGKGATLLMALEADPDHLGAEIVG